VKLAHQALSSSTSRHPRRLHSVLATALLMVASALLAVAQQASVTIHGTVLTSAGKPVGDAAVKLQQKGIAGALETKSDASGAFTFSALPVDSYLLSAEKSGLRSRPTTAPASPPGDQRQVDLVLDTNAAPSTSSAQAMEFADQPNFTVAGVTDWTAVGGHGSDSTLRTSEDLARETLTLKPQGSATSPSNIPGQTTESESQLRAALAGAPGSFEANHQLGEFYLHAARDREAAPLLQAAYQIDPANSSNEHDLALAYQGAGDFSQARDHARSLLAHHDDAGLHRLLAELDENMGDPLAAVHEDEQAVRLDPNEQNYFAWGSELLLHRAVWQAVEVFKNGTKAHPTSGRMLTALGTALFAGDLYDESAVNLCAASDLQPADPEPYIFMGKVEMASPKPLACVAPRLARFAQQQPANAIANYLYAMSLWKRQEHSADPQALHQVETLLTQAVTIDPACADAYLQLGILAYSQHNPEPAIGFYTKAIEANPQLGEAHYRLGVAYDRMGAAQKARQEFQLHDEIEALQAAKVERQRREVKQFLVVLQSQPTYPAAH
jgi:tetratricopeptide (TPR) repeat protein